VATAFVLVAFFTTTPTFGDVAFLVAFPVFGWYGLAIQFFPKLWFANPALSRMLL
jgi:hypothetical protein